MPPRGLPGNADLEQLKQGAEAFARAVRSGDSGAAEVVREFHPRLSRATPGSSELAEFTCADAQIVIARRFDFSSWPKLKAYLELVADYTRSPHHQAIGEPIIDRQGLIDEFLRLACLNYGEDDPARWAGARALLEANPEVATAGIHTIAVIGDIAAARDLLARDPAQARVPGGPHRWEPILYLAYSRLEAPAPGRSALDVARRLLAHGGDPNAGYLWEGLSPPFTALTGAFGNGEGDSPAHPDGLALARLLLEHGADPNDAQTLYNRQWDPDDAWLELLFEFGLGTGDGGRWHRLLEPQHPTPGEMLEDLLISAAHHGLADRVRLLLGHGVDPDGVGTGHPIYGSRTPLREAALWGYPGIVAQLQAAGASSVLDAVDMFIAASMRADRAATQGMLSGDPALRKRAIARAPAQLVRAAERNSLDAVALLIDLGFDVNAIERTAALHEAAMRGNLELIRLLLDHGADPNARDHSYHATPAGWAAHHEQSEAERYLAGLEDRS